MSPQSSVASIPTKKFLAFALGFRKKEELACSDLQLCIPVIHIPDSEEDIKQQEDRGNLKNKTSKRKKRDEEPEGAETRKKENSERAEGNQSPKEELSLAALEEEANPPPSSLMILGDYDRKPVQKVTSLTEFL